jgi:hypothetical protein
MQYRFCNHLFNFVMMNIMTMHIKMMSQRMNSVILGMRMTIMMVNMIKRLTNKKHEHEDE